MKQQFLIIFACLTVCGMSAYVPVTGPLELNDTIDASGFVIKRGAIMHTLLHSTELHGCLRDVMKFDGVDSVEKLSSYQTIMHKLDNLSSLNNKLVQDVVLAQGVIEALEYAIMYVYDKHIYIVGGYTAYLSIVFSGLRWRALNPFSYLNPFSWCGENHEKGTQLIYEFEQLSKIAEKYGNVYRLKATTFSYKHWRVIRLLGAAAVTIWAIAIIKNELMGACNVSPIDVSIIKNELVRAMYP